MVTIQERDGCGELIDVSEGEETGDDRLEKRKSPAPKAPKNENPVTDKSVVFGNVGTEIGKYENDARQLLAVFPEEVWWLIAQKMVDPNDAESLSNASLFFRNLLRRQRVIFLFPKVWNLVGRQFHHRQYELERAGDEESFSVVSSSSPSNCSDCGKQRTAKWYSDILNCRLVCQGWCDGVDKFYVGMNHQLSELSNDHVCSGTSVWTVNVFGSGGDQENMLRHFHRTHGGTESTWRSPFFGRACFIDCDFEENPMGFNGIVDALRKYGQHIWYCKISNPDIFPTLFEWYSKVKDLLMLMPNLKNLYVARLPDFHMNGQRSYEVGDPRITTLAQQIDSNPLPELKNLECISTEGLWSHVFKELIRIGKQITSLDIDNDEYEQQDSEKYDVYSAQLPNLKQLRIRCLLEDDVFPEVKVNWPLEKMEVDFEFENGNWLQIFHMLENWAETLTNVTISLPQRFMVENERDMDEWLSLRLQLPHVKMFRVEVHTLFSLDFILPMKESLESLEISTLHDGTGIHHRNKLYRWARDKQIIQFWGWSDRLEESNIWRLFPKLKVLRLDDKDKQREDDDEDACICTREDWQNRIAENLRNGKTSCGCDES